MAGPYPPNDAGGSDGPHIPGLDGTYGQAPAVPFPERRSRRRWVCSWCSLLSVLRVRLAFRWPLRRR